VDITWEHTCITIHLELDELKNYLLVSIARTMTHAYCGFLRSVANHLYLIGLRAGSASVTSTRNDWLVMWDIWTLGHHCSVAMWVIGYYKLTAAYTLRPFYTRGCYVIESPNKKV